jgi:hypothetical protein
MQKVIVSEASASYPLSPSARTARENNNKVTRTSTSRGAEKEGTLQWIFNSFNFHFSFDCSRLLHSGRSEPKGLVGWVL